MKKSMFAMIGVGVLGFALQGSLASANSCSKVTSNWFNASLKYSCNFSGGGSAQASSLSGEVNPGQKGLIADLISTSNVPNGQYVYAAAIGLDTSGADISGCRTGNDISTAQGATTGDGDGCENGATHRLLILKSNL